MKMINSKKITDISWSNVELSGLLEDEESRVYFEKAKKHLGLHPYHLTDLNAALREILNTNLNCYDSELNGLLLAYKNPKLMSPLGDILYDTHFVHIDIEADFYIFKPEVGLSLKGFVNKKGTNHIVILVHKTFNVSVPKPDDEENDEWPGYKVKVGQQVKFKIEEINFKTKIPYIRGSLHENEYLEGCQLFNEEIAATCETEFQEVTRWKNNENKAVIDKKPIIKRENKRIVFNDDFEDEEYNDNVETKASVSKLKVDVADAQSPNKTKKEKGKSLLHSNTDNESDNESEVQKSQAKKHKKQSTKIENDTDSEKKYKPLIKSLTNQHSDGSTDTENNETLKKSKKRKKKSAEYDTEDEKKHKLTIDKSLTQNPDDKNEATSESELSQTKSKKKKKKVVEYDTEDEKRHKLTIDRSVAQNLNTDVTNEATSESELSQTKSKKKKKKVIEYDTEDEKKHKLTIDKSVTQNLNTDETNEATSESELSQTKSRKKKKKVIEYDTEDEKKHKLTIDKSLAQNLISNDENDGNDAESESEYPLTQRKKLTHKPNEYENNELDSQSSKTKLKTRKRSFVDGDDTEDEKNYKKSIKSLTETLSVADTEMEFKLPMSPPKKRKKKSTHCDNVDEDEVETNTSLTQKSIASDANTDESNSDSPKKQSKKRRKTSYVDADSLNDTEDERNYKLSLKPLVKEMTATKEAEEKFQVPQSPIKKHKKKHKSHDINEDTGKDAEDEKIQNGESTKSNNIESNVSKKMKKNKVMEDDDTLIDTEDERNYKKSLKKLTEMLPADNSEMESGESINFPQKRKKKSTHSDSVDKSFTDEANSDKSNSDSPKKQSKKRRKASYVDADSLNDTEDERNYKLSLKPLVKEMTTTQEEFQVPQSPIKKHKKKHKSHEINQDTGNDAEDEKSIINQELQNGEFNESNNIESNVSKKTKKNKVVEDYDTVMDTDDERNYKKSLQSLVKSIENGTEVNNFELDKTLKKMNKKTV